MAQSEEGASHRLERQRALADASFFFFKMPMPSVQFKDEHGMARVL